MKISSGLGADHRRTLTSEPVRKNARKSRSSFSESATAVWRPIPSKLTSGYSSCAPTWCDFCAATRAHESMTSENNVVFNMALRRVDFLPAARMPEDTYERSANEAGDAPYRSANTCIQVAPPIAFAASRASDAVSDTYSERGPHP